VARIDGREIGHRNMNKRLGESPYLMTSRTNSWLGHPKHRRGLATMHGGTVVTSTSDAATFHVIGSISPGSVFRTARSTTTMHGTRLQSTIKPTSAANTELDSTVAMVDALSVMARSGEPDTVATKLAAPTVSTRLK
jgi:hypothetical protein